MFRKLTVLATALILFLSVPLTAFASTGTITGYPNFRSAPSTSSKVYENLKNGQKVTVLEKVNSHWVKIRANGRTGYVSTKYIRLSQSSSTRQGTITKGVNFRSAPSTSGRVIRMLSRGTKVTVLEQVNSYWVKIRVGNQTGYVSSNYINISGSSSGSSSKSSSSRSSSSSSVSKRLDAIVSTAHRFLGTPYKFGATYEKDRKFDCSSFVQYVFRQNGTTLPRTTREQAKMGVKVSKSNLRKGDLLFFTVRGGKSIGHVAIYAGNGRMIHTYGTGGVRYDNLNSKYWTDNFVTARRIIR